MRRPSAALAILLAALPAPGRAQQIVAQQIVAQQIVVGAVYALTGPAAPSGLDAQRAIKSALDIINTKHEPIPILMGQGGGLGRIGNRQLSIAFADDASDPAQAKAAAERLVTEQHAIALVGGLSDAAVAAISGVAEAHGIPYLSLDSTEANQTGLTWFFHLGRTPDRDARASLGLLAAVAGNRKLQTLALVYEDTEVGRDGSAALRQAADAAGLSITADLKVPVGATSLAAEALVIAGVTPDAVLLVLRDAQSVLLLRQLAAQHAAPLILGTGPFLRDPAAVAQLGPAAEGTFGSVGYTPGPIPARPGLPQAEAVFTARTGKPLDPASARELTGILLLADAINRAASTKPIDLRTALMATDTPGGQTLMLWNGIRFDDSGQNVLATPALQQIQHGAYQIVAPDAVATAPIIPVVPDVSAPTK